MSFQASDIGTHYDVGIATRPNLDGSTLTFNCLNENGAPVPLSQVAFMFLADDEVEESVDLIRKDQLIRLSSANLIDREFTLYPQATQGNWTGGELQRIFSDATAYYQGRGLIWPTSSFVPVLPSNALDIGSFVDSAGNIITTNLSLQGWLASGYLGAAGSGVLHSFQATSAAGTAYRVFFTLTQSASRREGNIVSSTAIANRPLSGTLVNGLAFFTVTGDNNIYQLTYASGQAFNATVIFATLPQNAGQLYSGYIGKDWVLVATPTEGAVGPIRIFFSGSATFVDVTLPPGNFHTSVAIIGSVIYIACTDGNDSLLLAYDVTSQQTSTIANFPGVGNINASQLQYPYGGGLRLVGAQGQLFILAYCQVGPIPSNQYLLVDCYLYSGSLQFITRLNSVTAGLPPSLAYNGIIGISNLASYAQYVFFAVRLSVNVGGRPQAIVMAYDVVRGTFFTATDQFSLSFVGTFASQAFLEMGIAITPGADANLEPSPPVLGRVPTGSNLLAGNYTIQTTFVGSTGESRGSDPVTITLLAGDSLLINQGNQRPLGWLATNTYLTAAPATVNLGLLPAPGITLSSKTQALGGTPPATSSFGTSGDFTIFVAERDPNNNQVAPSQVMRMLVYGNSLAGLPLLSGGGRVISSVIDFTSASVKLYRMLIATHEPIPANAQFSLYAYLDVDGDNLPADTVYKITNIQVGATVTVLPINVLAKKLVYIADWSSTPGAISPHPISIAIQAATGWVFTIPLALSDSALPNGANPGDYAFQKQDKQLDALAARNFIRQLWRQRGGQCIVSYADGDSYNAVIQDYHVTAKKFKSMNQPGDRKVRYEGRLILKIAEDL